MEATFATLTVFAIDLSREEEQTFGLKNVVVPGVRQHEGFVSGHWTLDREAREATVLLTFATRDAAEAMAANIRANRENQHATGLDLRSLRIVEVIASA